jgi:hypothetical protein
MVDCESINNESQITNEGGNNTPKKKVKVRKVRRSSMESLPEQSENNN